MFLFVWTTDIQSQTSDVKINNTFNHIYFNYLINFIHTYINLGVLLLHNLPFFFFVSFQKSNQVLKTKKCHLKYFFF